MTIKMFYPSVVSSLFSGMKAVCTLFMLPGAVTSLSFIGT